MLRSWLDHVLRDRIGEIVALVERDLRELDSRGCCGSPEYLGHVGSIQPTWQPGGDQ